MSDTSDTTVADDVFRERDRLMLRPSDDVLDAGAALGGDRAYRLFFAVGIACAVRRLDPIWRRALWEAA